MIVSTGGWVVRGIVAIGVVSICGCGTPTETVRVVGPWPYVGCAVRIDGDSVGVLGYFPNTREGLAKLDLVDGEYRIRPLPPDFVPDSTYQARFRGSVKLGYHTTEVYRGGILIARGTFDAADEPVTLRIRENSMELEVHDD